MPLPRYSSPTVLAGLRHYFYSGWIFLIPYLAVYLLYYVTSWPVNPVTNLAPIAHRPLPPLLHVYWALHTIHAILAGIALWSWFIKRKADASLHGARYSPLSTCRYSLLVKLAPWAILALIFYIPGVYLEWPSDPWEHLRRINEWRSLDTVGAHSSWNKSSYFIPYSLLSQCMGLRQLFWLDFYYTGICLLLCWQYYRLSRACGIGERASMVFVILQALLLGNNIFSFYRYYGISSSIYAQLAAVAITRLFLEWAAFGRTNLYNQDTTTASNVPGNHPPPNNFLRVTFWHFPALFKLLAVGSCLLGLAAFNHFQGIGIAGLGIAAVIVWRLIEWKRSALRWLIAGTLGINALFLCLYPRTAAIEALREQGWLNIWYGFNIVDFGSQASDRFAQILSFAGLTTLLAALILIRRNLVVAWLTILPLLFLCSPAVALPLAKSLASHYDSGSAIVTFQRFLLASPILLAACALPLPRSRDLGRRTSVLATTVVLAAMVIIAPSKPYYSRTWHTLSSTPLDLKYQPALELYDKVPSKILANSARTLISAGMGLALDALGAPKIFYRDHRIISPESPAPRRCELLVRFITVGWQNDSITGCLLGVKPAAAYTPASQAARLAQHWPTQEALMTLAGFREAQNAAIYHGGNQVIVSPFLSYYYFGPPSTQDH